MRLNKYIARATGMSRRAADRAIESGHIKVNGIVAGFGVTVEGKDAVTHSGKKLTLPKSTKTIILNKPENIVCSRDGQGSRTVYSLLPEDLHNLKPVGRLDKHSSGLLVMTDDGDLAYELTHPKFAKNKVYEVILNRPLNSIEQKKITNGVMLDDGISKLQLEPLDKDFKKWKITMQEGRNRQIRRTFEALGLRITTLHRTMFGNFKLEQLKPGTYRTPKI